MTDALEAALATRWERDTFAVYADALQQSNDPRGEWIALELAMLRDGVTPTAQQRRDKLLAKHHANKFYLSRFAYGFIDELIIHPGLLSNRRRVVEITATLLAGPLGPYVRRIVIEGDAAFVADITTQLAARPRPWLYELALSVRGEFRTPAIKRDTLDALVAAAPRLDSIWIAGDTPIVELFGGFKPPPHIAVTAEPTTRVRGQSMLVVNIPHLIAEELELSRLERLHAGTVDEMSDPTREAWAALRWLVDRGDRDPRSRGPHPFPAPSLARICREIDLDSFYGADWVALDRKLQTATEVQVGTR